MPSITTFLYDSLRQFAAPKGKAATPGGVSSEGSFNPSQATVSQPQYREHVEDIFQSRLQETSTELLEKYFRHDPDISAALNAFLTVSNTEFIMEVYDADSQLSREGFEIAEAVLDALTVRSDYTTGFEYRPSFETICENIKYMMLLRGMSMFELVLGKDRLPIGIRHIDMKNVKFDQPANGILKPYQEASGGRKIQLDVPTIFLGYFHRFPTELYNYSAFSASINTIAARAHVINTLYRIMDKTGTPRIHIKVLEEVIIKNAPADVMADEAKKKAYVGSILQNVASTYSNLRPDSALITTDSVSTGMVGEGKSSAELNITSVIKTLNDQNQAALKSMSTVLGRGESGVNTSSTEARLFALNADELNRPVAEMLSHMLTLSVRLSGFDGYVKARFAPVELRPNLELEGMRSVKQTRLHKDLSLGLITDEDYQLEMYNTYQRPGIPTLSGTGFLDVSKDGTPESDPTDSSDPLNKNLTPENGGAAQDSRNK